MKLRLVLVCCFRTIDQLFKIEWWKMSKKLRYLNGCDRSHLDSATEEMKNSIVSAFLDDQSIDIRALDDREKRKTLSNTVPKTNLCTDLQSNAERSALEGLLQSLAEIIDAMRENIEEKDRTLSNSKPGQVSVRLDHHTMCLFPKSDLDSTDNASEVRSAVVESMSPVSSESAGISKPRPLPTRCFGRVSSRAIKRRNNLTPKTPPGRRAKVKAAPLTQPLSTASGAQEEPMKREVRSMGPTEIADTKKNFFLTTDKAYFLPDYRIQPLTSSPLRKIDVPSWESMSFKDLHKMERTEDISDTVFLSRHKKGEVDEIRSKKWELQKLRQQNATKKQKNKQRKSKNSVQRESQSFYPDPNNIEYIEVTKELPVLAFGHPIPFFQPCEFSLPWCCDGSSSTDSLGVPKAKRGRPSVT